MRYAKSKDEHNGPVSFSKNKSCTQGAGSYGFRMPPSIESNGKMRNYNHSSRSVDENKEL